MTDASLLVIEIIERASTMRERLSDAFVPCLPASSERVDELLDEWCRAAAKGDAASFDRRLALDRLDHSLARAALGPVQLASGAGIPEWARLLERYIDSLARPQSTPPVPEPRAEMKLLDREADVPFGELFTELVRLADLELATCAGAALAQVSPTAREGLRSSLTRRLARIAAPLLSERFNRHRSERTPANATAGARLDACPAPARLIYREFVLRMLEGGMLELLRQYPVLARLMATTALLWRDATAEFLRRLAEDGDAIAEHFADGHALGDLVAVRPDLSDPHAGGRAVHSLTFACGLRLIYKPRALGIDAAFGELLRWLAVSGSPLPPVTLLAFAPRVLDRGGHGWAEYLEHRECRDHAAARRYYRHAGALLSLLHALGSTDCHYENIMAVGDVPVLIDLETLLQPELERVVPPVDRARNIGARRLYDDSVLRTGMLPIWQAAGGDSAYDIGGLSADAGQVTQFRAAVWTQVNTDAMRLSYRRAGVGAYANLPRLAGIAVPPTEYVDEISLGFSMMYEWLGAHADSLLAHDGPLERLAREQVRFITRPSSVYDHVLRRSLRSGALHDGAAWSVELELLARGLLPLASSLWSLLREEQCALERLDIPIFTVRGDATAVALAVHDEGGAGRAELPVARSGLEVARSRFAAISPGDLARQLQIIRASFALRYADDPAAPTIDRVADRAVHAGDNSGSCSRSELLAAGRDIAGEIEKLALMDADGHVTWITTEPISTSGHSRLQATDYGLYGGLAGMAIFLAAAARCYGDPGIGALARRALLPLRERLRSHRPTYAEEFGIGGACGSASAVYALLRSGTLLDDHELVDDAVCAAEQITLDTIAADSSHDVLYGAAGTILALLALHRVDPAPWMLERALACGSHLVANRNAAPARAGARHYAWRDSAGRMLLGFAHGAAGIAYALLRLHDATGCADFREAALDAMRYADSLFDEERHEWPDLRTPGRAERACDVSATWCHGAAGIGLGRLGSLAACDDPELRLGLERAIVAIDPNGPGPISSPDHLCCGSSGTIELLLAAGIRQTDPALVTAAHARASAMVRRRNAVGSYRLLASPVAGVVDPALYRGTAGIGYCLLRLCHPEMLPSLLLWE